MEDTHISSSDQNGLRLHLCNTDKFKTMSIMLMMQAPLEEDLITARSLIPHILNGGSTNYPNRKRIKQNNRSETMPHLLEIKNITKSFGHKVVLKEVTFNVPFGSIVAFIGDNGAGKSTTFKAILGLITKDSGTVKIFGEENIDKHAKLKEKIGVVFDAMNLPAHLTIKQLNKVFEKLFKSWDQAQFYRLVHAFSLPTDQKVNKLSRGMSMKLSVAVALSHNAKLLILDEATGGLDPSSREELLDELKNFVSTSNGGILLSSHIMSDVEKIASHVVFIKDGEILLNEEKDKIFESYAIVDIDEKQLTLLDKDIVVAKRNSGSYFSVLISDKQALPKGIPAKTISMEEISVLLTRSEK